MEWVGQAEGEGSIFVCPVPFLLILFIPALSAGDASSFMTRVNNIHLGGAPRHPQTKLVISYSEL